MQYDTAMQSQAQAAAAQGMALRYVGSLDFTEMKCTVELKVNPYWTHAAVAACCLVHSWQLFDVHGVARVTWILCGPNLRLV